MTDDGRAPRVLGLVADDLTGAGDAAAGFADRGWPVTLHLQPIQGRAAGIDGPAVVAVTTGSRAMPDDEAAVVTGAAVEALAEAGADRIYLKIDSTARGTVAGQISGALKAWSRRHPDASAVICPAFPSQGRTVVDNIVLVDGVPVAETAAATDPVTPRSVSDLSVIIPGAVRGSVTDRYPRLIVDASTDADLDAVAGRLVSLGPALIMVGSGGLAAALGRAWTPTPVRHSRPAESGPILVAVSSLHPVTAGQLGRLDRADDVHVLITGTDAVTPVSAAAELADRVAAALAEQTYAALILIGGDGAAAVLGRVHADRIAIDGTVLDGCPAGIISGGAADGLRLITKSGGFGGPDTISDLIVRLRAGTPSAHDHAASRHLPKESS